MRIHITKFVRRQTESSPFSHWTLTDEELLNRIHRNFARRKSGYRDGVVLVPVEPDGFFCSIVQLQPCDLLVGEYKARRENEEPRKSTYAVRGKKLPAQSVDVVLYSHGVLAEKNENETDADWEIVSVNANPTVDEVPISPGTLIANHLELSGGTATKMTDAEFVAALRKSVEYWKDKANLAPWHLAALMHGGATVVVP